MFYPSVNPSVTSPAHGHLLPFVPTSESSHPFPPPTFIQSLHAKRALNGSTKRSNTGFTSRRDFRSELADKETRWLSHTGISAHAGMLCGEIHSDRPSLKCPRNFAISPNSLLASGYRNCALLPTPRAEPIMETQSRLANAIEKQEDRKKEGGRRGREGRRGEGRGGEK